MKILFSTGIVIYYKKKEKIEYLLLHYASGHWDFPKGKIEKGETKGQAAIRELQEEAGLTADIHEGFEHTFEYLFKDKGGELTSKKVYFFVGESKTKQVTLSHEHIDFEWLPFEQALQKLTYDNAKGLLHEADMFLKK